MRKYTMVGGAIALGLMGALAFAGMATAQAPDPVATRQANFKQVGGAFKAVGDQLKTEAPDVAVVKANTAKLKTLASALPTWFPAGSTNEKSKAKAEVWSDAAGFSAAAKTFADATAKLDELAQAGDVEGVKAQAKSVGMACGGCHTKYREKTQ